MVYFFSQSEVVGYSVGLLPFVDRYYERRSLQAPRSYQKPAKKKSKAHSGVRSTRKEAPAD